MNEVLKAAAELQSVCQAQGWRFCFIGGVALLRWGQPRETVDADLSLLTGFGGEERFVRTLLDAFPGRIPDAADFALQHRVLLLRSSSGVGLDVSLAALPYEELVISRATEFAYPPGITLRTCSAEDLLVLKAFAGRSQDWVDVERLITRQSGRLDWVYIEQQLHVLSELRDEPGLVEEVRLRRAKFES